MKAKPARPRALADLSPRQWEALCTRCGECCREKEQDEETGAVIYLDEYCQYFDPQTRRCTVYAQRHSIEPECLPLTPENVPTLDWLPDSCAYRKFARLLPAQVRRKSPGTL